MGEKWGDPHSIGDRKPGPTGRRIAYCMEVEARKESQIKQEKGKVSCSFESRRVMAPYSAYERRPASRLTRFMTRHHRESVLRHALPSRWFGSTTAPPLSTRWRDVSTKTKPPGGSTLSRTTGVHLPKVRTWRDSQGFSEHGCESAWCTVTRLQSRVRDFCTLGQKPHPLHESKLLPPFPKRHSNLLLEQSFDGSLSRRSPLAQLSESSRIARIAHQYFCDSKQPWIGQMGKLQRDRLHRFQLIKNDGDQVHLPFHRFLQSTHATGVKDQFLEQS